MGSDEVTRRLLAASSRPLSRYRPFLRETRGEREGERERRWEMRAESWRRAETRRRREMYWEILRVMEVDSSLDLRVAEAAEKRAALNWASRTKGQEESGGARHLERRLTSNSGLMAWD